MTKNQILGIGAALIFLICCTAAGELKRSRGADTENAPRYLTENAAEGLETGEIRLTEQEAGLLNELSVFLERGEMEAAGRLLNQNEEALSSLYYETAEGRPCRYAEGALSYDVEGAGLVLKGDGTCFYGTFSDAGPEGFCRAVKGTALERPRCDFSEGQWKKGKMEGPGKTGYSYYEGTTGEEVASVLRQGDFSQDLLDGSFTYSSTNGEGKTSVWTMEADRGRLVLDDRWEYLDDKLEYRLPSDSDETHVYVVFKSRAQEAAWGNALVWE